MDKSYVPNDEWELNFELLENVRRWVEAGNKRGHASLGAVPKNAPKRDEEPGHNRKIQERDWVNVFAELLSAKFGREIIEIQSNPDDPPDCFAEEEGKIIGIEVTELVKGDILHRIALNRFGKKEYSPSEQFTNEQWVYDDFIQRIQYSIDKKDERARVKGKIFDILLIYTDEIDLSPEYLEEWLSNGQISATYIKEVFLLRSHCPHYSERSPLFKVDME